MTGAELLALLQELPPSELTLTIKVEDSLSMMPGFSDIEGVTLHLFSDDTACLIVELTS